MALLSVESDIKKMFEECVVCNSNDFEVLKAVRWDLVGQGHYDVNFGVCKSCGQVGQNPFPRPQEIEAFYSKNVNYNSPEYNVVLPEKPFSTRLRLRDITRRMKPEKGTILEIGCGSGANLYYLQKDGWDVHGCEPSPSGSLQAKERLGEDKITVGFSGDIKFSESAYDVAFISHVLEHVTAPKIMMEQAVTAVKQDGLVIFEVPCIRQPHRLMPGWLSLEHILYFSAGTITRLAEDVGLEVVETILDDEYHLYPAVCIVCRVAKEKISHNYFNEYEQNKHIVKEFLETDRVHWAAVEEKFSDTSEAYIYAAGNHTSQLLFETEVEKHTKILGIIDSNPVKEGKKLGPYTVIGKEKFKEQYNGEAVAIVSYFSQNPIAEGLKELGVPDDKIIRLY